MKHHIKPYEIMDHTADMAIRVRGKTLEDLFENAAFSLFDNIATLQEIKEESEEKILLDAVDLQELMVNWLNHLLYLWDTRHMIFKRFHVHHMSRTTLEAEAWGEAYKPGSHELLTDIKAATYHNLLIEKHAGVWTAEILLDI